MKYFASEMKGVEKYHADTYMCVTWHSAPCMDCHVGVGREKWEMTMLTDNDIMTMKHLCLCGYL